MRHKWIYVDVNVLYYYFTAHPEYGEGSKELIAKHYGRLCTSALSAWLLYVLIRDLRVVGAVGKIARLLDLNADVLRLATALDKPGDFEDRVHLATMRIYGIDTILSNDSDFDGVGVVRIPPVRS